MSDSCLAYISIGSNMGDPLENCRQGIAALDRSGQTQVAARSRFYRTEPVDYTDQDWFVNAVVAVRTRLEPDDLLACLQSIQQAAGRTADAVRFGPRILDLDVLLYNGRILEGPALTVPHPRMHTRRFVLQPICDIDPDIVHPVLNKTMAQLLAELDRDEQDVIVLTCDC